MATATRKTPVKKPATQAKFVLKTKYGIVKLPLFNEIPDAIMDPFFEMQEMLEEVNTLTAAEKTQLEKKLPVRQRKFITNLVEEYPEFAKWRVESKVPFAELIRIVFAEWPKTSAEYHGVDVDRFLGDSEAEAGE